MKKIILIILSILLISILSVLSFAMNSNQFVHVICKDDSLYYDPNETEFIGVMKYRDIIINRKIVDSVMTEMVDGVFTDAGMDDNVKLENYCEVYKLKVNLVEVLN